MKGDNYMRIDRKKLKIALIKKDMSQKELSKRSGVARATISYIVNGKSCSDEVGQKIAAALDVNVTDILEYEG